MCVIFRKSKYLNNLKNQLNMSTNSNNHSRESMHQKLYADSSKNDLPYQNALNLGEDVHTANR